jgi:hypothetical protein
MAYSVLNGKLVRKEKRAGYRYEPLQDVVKEEFPKNKGQYQGSCNRRACLAPGANWYNRGSYAFYCEDCAFVLNDANRHDDFCKNEPLCYKVNSTEEAKYCYVM